MKEKDLIKIYFSTQHSEMISPYFTVAPENGKVTADRDSGERSQQDAKTYRFMSLSKINLVIFYLLEFIYIYIYKFRLYCIYFSSELIH